MGLFFAIVFATIVGVVHFGTHRLAGDERTFDEAGVSEAGIAVVVVAFLFGLLIGP